VLIIFTPCQIFDIINGYGVITKNLQFLKKFTTYDGCQVMAIAHLTLWVRWAKNVMAWTRKYYLKNNYLTLRSKSHKCHYGMRHTALWSCTHIPNKYNLKNNYLTLRSKVKVPWRSLQYVTHRLMVMHPHTKYNWSIWKNMVRTSFARRGDIHISYRCRWCSSTDYWMEDTHRD
jgi:hypothetical protein